MSKGSVSCHRANDYVVACTYSKHSYKRLLGPLALFVLRSIGRCHEGGTRGLTATASLLSKSPTSAPATGVFDEAIKGVDLVAHLAPPVSLYFSDPRAVLHTATRATRRCSSRQPGSQV